MFTIFVRVNVYGSVECAGFNSGSDNTSVILQGAAKKWTPKIFRHFLSNRLDF